MYKFYLIFFCLALNSVQYAFKVSQSSSTKTVEESKAGSASGISIQYFLSTVHAMCPQTNVEHVIYATIG